MGPLTQKNRPTPLLAMASDRSLSSASGSSRAPPESPCLAMAGRARGIYEGRAGAALSTTYVIYWCRWPSAGVAAIDPGHMTDDEPQPAKKQKGGKYPKGVSETGRKTIRFQARVGYKPSPDGKTVQRSAGTFDTPEEAALQVARHLGPEGSAAAAAPPPPPPTGMSEAEVHAAVRAEGLTLVPSGGKTGFKNVYTSGRRCSGVFLAMNPIAVPMMRGSCRPVSWNSFCRDPIFNKDFGQQHFFTESTVILNRGSSLMSTKSGLYFKV